jgi:hypothetical protein
MFKLVSLDCVNSMVPTSANEVEDAHFICLIMIFWINAMKSTPCLSDLTGRMVLITFSVSGIRADMPVSPRKIEIKY